MHLYEKIHDLVHKGYTVDFDESSIHIKGIRVNLYKNHRVNSIDITDIFLECKGELIEDVLVNVLEEMEKRF